MTDTNTDTETISYVALLRGINVGSHTVKMADLKILFQSLGFEDVTTYIASGNVLFKNTEKNIENLEKTIEEALKNTYRFTIAVMIRTTEEMEQLVADSPFDEENTTVKKYVTFLKSELSESSLYEITSNLENGEQVILHGREIYFTIPAESIFADKEDAHDQA